MANSVNSLPIKPKITPALGLAGAILIVSGAVYALIGIKSQWLVCPCRIPSEPAHSKLPRLYVFFGAAYLATLSVTVLIIYLMKPPVSDAVQGAFFVAASVTGLIFGGIALVFRDVSEGLGCLLGGFCVSMWFLTLKADGLITSTVGRAIFIGCMSFTGFALSWTRRTRNYVLIGSISFSGATICMLGVDCFSRAGWKEFWVSHCCSPSYICPSNIYSFTSGVSFPMPGNSFAANNQRLESGPISIEH